MLSSSLQAAIGHQRCSTPTSRAPGLLKNSSSSSRLRQCSWLTRGLKETVQQLAPIDDLQQVVVGGGSEPWVIANAPGKKASLVIYAHLAKKYNGQLTPAAAKEGLQLYGEYVEEAQQQPGSHPNIDLLLDVVASGSSRALTVE
jgi:hypothetical protein